MGVGGWKGERKVTGKCGAPLKLSRKNGVRGMEREGRGREGGWVGHTAVSAERVWG